MNELLDAAIAEQERRARRSKVIGFVLLTVLVSPVGYALAAMAGVEGNLLCIAAGVVVGSVIVLAGYAVVSGVQWMSARAVETIMMPGGAARDTGSISQAQALAAAGRHEDAAALFEAVRATHGENREVLRAEAEYHAAPGGDPQRAALLLQQLRRLPDATAADELYATHRLIDLYLGALNDNGRVLVELRRMADRFPDTIDGQGALAELRRRRDELHASNGDPA